MKYLIDSKDVQNTSSDYIYSFIAPLNQGLEGNYSINRVFLYKSFYSISAIRKNNIFKLDAQTAITIPDGSYSIDSFCSFLDTKLKLIDANFAVTYSNITMKITITNTSVFKIDFDATTCKKLIGFPTSSGLSTAALSITSTNPYNMAGFSRFNINIDGCNEIATTSQYNRMITYALYNTDFDSDGTLYHNYEYNPNDKFYLNNFDLKVWFTFDNEATHIPLDNFIIEFVSA